MSNPNEHIEGCHSCGKAPVVTFDFFLYPFEKGSQITVPFAEIRGARYDCSSKSFPSNWHILINGEWLPVSQDTYNTITDLLKSKS